MARDFFTFRDNDPNIPTVADVARAERDQLRAERQRQSRVTPVEFSDEESGREANGIRYVRESDANGSRLVAIGTPVGIGIGFTHPADTLAVTFSAAHNAHAERNDD